MGINAFSQINVYPYATMDQKANVLSTQYLGGTIGLSLFEAVLLEKYPQVCAYSSVGDYNRISHRNLLPAEIIPSVIFTYVKNSLLFFVVVVADDLPPLAEPLLRRQYEIGIL